MGAVLERPMRCQILKNLVPEGRSWNAQVPAEMGTLLGHPLLLTIDTDWAAGRTHPLPPSESEVSLAELILANLSAILLRAEAQLIEYGQRAGGDSQHVHACEPHLWIDRLSYADQGPLRWALVVHHDDWPDFGWHIEFDGTEDIEIWAGS